MQNNYCINSGKLRSLFDNVSFAAVNKQEAAKSPRKYPLQAVEILVEHHRIRLTAADDGRLSSNYAYATEFPANTYADFVCHVMKDRLKIAISSIPKSKDLMMHVSKSHVTNDNVLHITDGFQNIETPLLDGEFPKWAKVIPDGYESPALVTYNTDKLLRLFKCLFIDVTLKMIKREDRLVRLEIETDKTTLVPSKKLEKAANEAIKKFGSADPPVSLIRLSNGAGSFIESENETSVEAVGGIMVNDMIDALKTVTNETVSLGYGDYSFEGVTMYDGKRFEMRHVLVISTVEHRHNLMQSPVLHLIMPKRI